VCSIVKTEYEDEDEFDWGTSGIEERGVRNREGEH
jgi:hypothetical protein